MTAGHLTNVGTVAGSTSLNAARYFAVCNQCPWVGPVVPEAKGAAKDATGHTIATRIDPERAAVALAIANGDVQRDWEGQA